MYCVKCGNKIAEGEKFCTQCGKAVEQVKETDVLGDGIGRENVHKEDSGRATMQEMELEKNKKDQAGEAKDDVIVKVLDKIIDAVSKIPVVGPVLSSVLGTVLAILFLIISFIVRLIAFGMVVISILYSLREVLGMLGF